MKRFIFEMDVFTNYLVAFTPILMGHVVLPPLAVFRGEVPPEQFVTFFSLIYSLLPVEFKTEDFVSKLLLHQGSSYQPFQSVSHMFVHANYDHLLGNLFHAFSFGLPVFKEFGMNGLYFFFLCGGIIGSIPSHLTDAQKNGVEKLMQRAMIIEEKKYVPKLLRPWMDKASTRIGTLTASAIQASRSCGSSGGVCALMGCEMVLLSRDLCLGIGRIIHRFNLNNSPSIQRGVLSSTTSTLPPRSRVNSSSVSSLQRNTNSTSHTNSNSDFLPLLWRACKETMAPGALVIDVIRLFGLSQFMYSDLSSVFFMGESNSFSSGMTIVERVLKAKDLASIGHVSHVQGALFGLSFGFLFGVVVPNIQRWSQLDRGGRPPSNSRTPRN